MIFINTRPVPVDDVNGGERRSSKAINSTQTPQETQQHHLTRVAVCVVLFYVLVSAFPVLLFYPVSLVSLLVPLLVLLYAFCTIRGDSKSDHWPCCMIAIVGVVVKVIAIIIYIMLFPLKDSDKKSYLSSRLQARVDHSQQHYRLIFFVILVSLEFFVLILGICLKWHLVAFEKVEHDATKRRATLTSNRPLISTEASRRASQA